MTSTLRLGAILAGAFLLAAFSTAQATPDASAQTPLEVTFMNPPDGATIGEPPFVIQMCFSRPINIKDLDAGGDFRFNLSTPENFGLGLRIVFQPDGWGYGIYPGAPPDIPATSPQRDHWLFEWRVVAADDGAVSEGQSTFKVDPAAEPIPGQTPPVCLPGGGTGTPVAVITQPATGSPPAATTPAATDEPSESASPEATEPVEEEGDDDGPDIGPLAFGTIAVAAGLAVVGLVMYFVRKRVGFDPHAPSEDGGGDSHGDEPH